MHKAQAREALRNSYSEDDDAAAIARCSRVSPAASAARSLPSLATLPLHSQSAVFANLCDDMAEVQARVDALQRTCDRYRQQLTTLEARRHDHCEHLASVYKDLAQFTEDGLCDTLCAAAHVQRDGGVLAGLEQLVRETVRVAVAGQRVELQDVLSRFGDEQQQRERQLAARLDAMQSALVALQHKVDTQDDHVQALSDTVTRLAQQLDATRATSVTRDELETAVRAVMASTTRTLSQVATPDTVQRLLEERQHALAHDLDAWRRSTRQELTQLQAAHEERVTGVLAAPKREDEGVVALKHDLVSLRAAVAALQDRVLHAPAAVQHRNDSDRDDAWCTAITADVAALRQGLSVLQEQRRDDRLALDTLQNARSLEGVFVEVRDWLADLEQRVMTRGETMELVHRVEEQLSRLRAELAAPQRLPE